MEQSKLYPLQLAGSHLKWRRSWCSPLLSRRFKSFLPTCCSISILIRFFFKMIQHTLTQIFFYFNNKKELRFLSKIFTELRKNLQKLKWFEDLITKTKWTFEINNINLTENMKWFEDLSITKWTFEINNKNWTENLISFFHFFDILWLAGRLDKILTYDLNLQRAT